ncbi:MAG: DNA gyrase subunit A [Anaerolineae bacterium]|nr:DNA gyrase subunit A [Anaerolineae bacterium]
MANQQKNDGIELGTVHQVDIDREMQAAYLDYAMSVIVARALPDARDGLKPVHRRILYAMHDLGLTYDKPYKKSARIVGEVLGKYHPHGDVAVYEAMARMAQDFAMRHVLVDGQGNFGSVDGDAPAAMRYTEARLARLAGEMLRDIDKETVDFGPNFDGTLGEPLVLPALLPNLLVNGASGIAVGMATNIPPHNLAEVCDALVYMIGRAGQWEEIGIADLLKFIPGPDFPTGGIVFRYSAGDGDGSADVIENAYAVGRGRFVVQAKAHIEEMSRSRHRIVVTELPYAVNKARLIERIAELVRDNRIEGITDVRDESDRTGMRLVIELTRTVEAASVLTALFKLTPLRTIFGVSMLALVEGEPRTLSLKKALQHYLEHRQEIVTRRTAYELRLAKERAHILEGLLKALSALDEVIQLIRRSQTTDTARTNLIKRFRFSEVQANAILDLPLKRLAQLERKKLEDEYAEKKKQIKYLEGLLASPQKILGVIAQELRELKERYAEPRRTQIVDRPEGILMARDLLPDQAVWVSVGVKGRVARQPAQPGDERALANAAVGTPAAFLAANTQDDLLLFTADGRAARLPVHQIPEGEGGPWDDLTGLGRKDRVVAALALPPATGERTGYLVLATRQGKVKRIALAEAETALPATPVVIGLDQGDEVAAATLSAGDGALLLATRQGQSISFKEEEARPMGLAAGGIGALRLGAGDEVIACTVVAPDLHLLAMTQGGFAKRTPFAEFPIQGRYGRGVAAAKLSNLAGGFVGVAPVRLHDWAVLVLADGQTRVLPAASIREMARATQGSRVAALGKGEVVMGCAVVPGAAPAPEAQPAPVEKAKPKKRAAAPKKEAPAKISPVPTAKAKLQKRAVAPTEKAPAKSAAAKVPAKGKAEAKALPKREATVPVPATGPKARTKAQPQPAEPAKPATARATKVAPGQTAKPEQEPVTLKRGKAKVIGRKPAAEQKTEDAAPIPAKPGKAKTIPIEKPAAEKPAPLARRGRSKTIPKKP